MIAHIVKTLTRPLVAGSRFRGRSSIHELSIASCGWPFWYRGREMVWQTVLWEGGGNRAWVGQGSPEAPSPRGSGMQASSFAS
jgi:hypothetical protein